MFCFFLWGGGCSNLKQNNYNNLVFVSLNYAIKRNRIIRYVHKTEDDCGDAQFQYYNSQ